MSSSFIPTYVITKQLYGRLEELGTNANYPSTNWTWVGREGAPILTDLASGLGYIGLHVVVRLAHQVQLLLKWN